MNELLLALVIISIVVLGTAMIILYLSGKEKPTSK